MKASVNVKFDRRRKYYLVLDCESATLPCAGNLPTEAKKNVAIAKPLIYDLGWKIIDKKGRVYSRKNFLISEISTLFIFFLPCRRILLIRAIKICTVFEKKVPL